MSLYRNIIDFIAGRAPESLCDDCVADHLALTRRQVSAAAPQIRGDGRFLRFAGRCSGCCTDRMVTVYRIAEIGQAVASEPLRVSAGRAA